MWGRNLGLVCVDPKRSGEPGRLPCGLQTLDPKPVAHVPQGTHGADPIPLPGETLHETAGGRLVEGLSPQGLRSCLACCFGFAPGHQQLA